MAISRGFWETTGAEKTFTHPLDRDLLSTYLPSPDAAILDYGCGYGRLTAELAARGYRHVRGVDTSRALIERGLREHRAPAPALDLRHVPGLPLPDEDATYDAALLFAVLTCVPEDRAQRRIVAELARLLRPGGVLYVSDMPLQNDAFHRHRYDTARHATRTYGVFSTPDGGTFRHHDPDYLRGLLRVHGLAIVEERTDPVPTLDGHTAQRLQLIARRPPCDIRAGIIDADLDINEEAQDEQNRGGSRRRPPCRGGHSTGHAHEEGDGERRASGGAGEPAAGAGSHTAARHGLRGSIRSRTA